MRPASVPRDLVEIAMQVNVHAHPRELRQFVGALLERILDEDITSSEHRIDRAIVCDLRAVEVSHHGVVNDLRSTLGEAVNLHVGYAPRLGRGSQYGRTFGKSVAPVVIRWCAPEVGLQRFLNELGAVELERAERTVLVVEHSREARSDNSHHLRTLIDFYARMLVDCHCRRLGPNGQFKLCFGHYVTGGHHALRLLPAEVDV